MCFELLSFFNPYHGKNFGEFLLEFFCRMGAFLTGKLSVNQLVSDEIQILVLSGVAISSALVGTFLVLRKLTMLANSLSHTILIGIVLAFVFMLFSSSKESDSVEGIAPMQIMLIAALLTGFFTAFLTEFLTKTMRLQEDASIGLVFTSLFALGVILVTVLTRNAHIGIEAVMGNADALHVSDLEWVYLIAACNVLLIILFFKEYKITTFDPALAYAMGISPLIFNYLLMTQVSATTITSFRAVGVLLVLAFMTGPVLAGRLFTHHLKILLLLAAGFGCLSVLIGVALTRHIVSVYGIVLSTTGVVVSTLLLMTIGSMVLCLFKKFYFRSLI